MRSQPPSDPDQRREAIRELLREEEIASQEELLARLERRGFQTSQPVLSRDLRTLNVAKQAGFYRVSEEERVTPLAALKSLLRSEQPVSHFVLLHCEPGAASAVARALEAEGIDGLVGTIAGDDTVLVASDSHAASMRVRRRVQELL
jgi:transcriptional regulator of arginine metabolism